ncbi:MAG: GIY-YIG nuclease family protein [Chloroflexi bacterium]|nr:GIY-YIG nuclease family protein [Chloroflexota bacterium]MCI0882455.1 GIY-YIG nuclease family protein [Chloroflexota bacterium]
MSPAMYILMCSDGSYYTGPTTNLEYRVAAHRMGLGGRWTSPRLPVRVVFTQDFPSLREAFEAERQIKGWSRAKKRALIEGRFDLLPGLARNNQDDRQRR